MKKCKTIDFALLGLGKLGSGFYKIWSEKRKKIRDQHGFDLNLKKVLVRNPHFKRTSGIDQSLLTTDINEIARDPSIKIAIDAIGGIEPTYSIIKTVLENKINLVSANRTLLSSKMHEIADMANMKKIIVQAEPSLGGGIPIISAIQRDLMATSVKQVTGILSGTSNYILSEMNERGISLEEVLRIPEVRKMGESLSIIDYEGSDAAQKVSIIAAAAFGIDVSYLHLYAEGISDISVFDMHCAKEFGYEFKLLAILKEHEDAFEIRVHPTLVPKKHPLITVRGEYNAFFINTDLLGNYMLYGRGVGIEATSSLILRDLVDITVRILNNSWQTDYDLSWNTKPVLPMDKVETSYYIRFPCLNRPGVIGEITSILGSFNINISSAHAEIDKSKGMEFGYVHILIEKAREKYIIEAIDEIKKQEIILDRIKYFRILEDME